MKKVLKVVLAAAMVLSMGVALVACGNSADTAAATGMYSVESMTINGQTITAEDIDATGSMSTDDVYIELKDGGNFTMKMLEEEIDGTFTVSGEEITLKSGLLDSGLTGAIAGGQITLEYEGYKLVFAK